MTSMNSRLPTFIVTFAAVAAAIYYFAVDNNWALFSYGPAVGEWTVLTHPASAGPTMYWYGWLTTAATAGTLAGLAACLLPQAVRKWIRPDFAWLVPLGSIAAMAYLLSGYFTR